VGRLGRQRTRQRGCLRGTHSHRRRAGAASVRCMRTSVMRPIELTRVLDNGNTKSFFVNPDHIVSFESGWIEFSTGNGYAVRETPEQIIGRLADHRLSLHAEEHEGIEVYR